MSIVIREKSRIKRYDNHDEYLINRTEDMIFDHIDDYHVRINKLFPLCSEAKEPSIESYKRFHLRFYIPLEVFQDKFKKVEKCFIMFNGLDEIDHFVLYDQIGKGLCKNGISAILLPLPDHLNRNAEYRFNSADKRRRPSESFINEPITIWEAYLQFVKEVEFLIQHLTGACHSGFNGECCLFYRQFFNTNVSISLLGYSLGGLIALTNFLIQKYNFNSCILINSGAKLNDIDVSEFQSEQEWQKTVKELSNVHYSLDTRNEIHRLFDMTFLGNNLPCLKDELREKCKKILFILGGADSVTKFRSIRQIEPDYHGLAILKLPGIHHFLSLDTHWDQWFPIVNVMIHNFDNSASNESLLPKDILSSLLYFQMKYRISERIDHIDLDRISDPFERDSLARTLFAAKGTYGAINKSLIEMYKLLERAKKRPHLYPDYTFKQHDNLFGSIAIRLLGINRRYITEALNIQKSCADKGEQVPYIGEILIRNGILTEDTVTQVLKSAHQRC